MRSRNNYVKESLTVPASIEQFRHGDLSFDEIKELKRRQKALETPSTDN